MNKKFSLRNVQTRSKITIFGVMMLAFMIFIAGCGVFAASEINKERKADYEYAIGSYYLSEAFVDFCNAKVALKNVLFVYYNDAANLQAQQKELTDCINDANENAGRFKEIMDDFPREIVDQFNKVNTAFEKWVEAANSNIALMNNGKRADAVSAHLNTEDGLADAAEHEVVALLDMLDKASDAKDVWVEKVYVAVIAILLVVSAIAIVLTCVFSSMIIKQITVPVETLSEAAKKLAIGDVDVDCQKLADDDLGILLDNFGQMVSAIKTQATIAQRLATGDMTVEVTPRSEKDVLGKALKKLAEDQNRTLSNVKESTMQVTVGAEQVAMASQNLAQGATEQASALEEVTVSVDDIAQRTKLNAAEASKANDLVHTVKKTAISGNNQMKDMKEAMNDINRTSENISKIIKVIDDIAFQTNILALNAAVEAARAGAHGKGFSVVAEEVRNLAGKSASAARETAEMIEDTIHKVQNGTQLANETEKSLDEIVNQINQIVDLIDSIATASNNQATAVSQIDQALGQVSQVVQTNSATSEECAAASDELSNQAASLRKLMANFRLSAGKSGSFDSSADLGFSAGNNYNDQIISLDGDYGKY